MPKQDQQSATPDATAPAGDGGASQDALAAKIAGLRADNPDTAQETATDTPATPRRAGRGRASRKDETATAQPAGPPVEGYDPELGAFVKTYALGVDLSAVDNGELVIHALVAPLVEDAARVAVSAGYRPQGAAELIDARPDGAKTNVSFAVPVVQP